MEHKRLNKNEKQAELEKYQSLILATIDYRIESERHFKVAGFDFDEHYKKLKTQTEEHYQKGRLSRLKQWFRDLTEMQIETGDLKFNKYLQDRTKYDIDIFKAYFLRIEKVIQKGKITSDKQFYDISTTVDQLCQIEPIDVRKIELLNNLLSAYEQRKLPV